MPESLIFLTENSPGVSNDRFGLKQLLSLPFDWILLDRGWVVTVSSGNQGLEYAAATRFPALESQAAQLFRMHFRRNKVGTEFICKFALSDAVMLA